MKAYEGRGGKFLCSQGIGISWKISVQFHDLVVIPMSETVPKYLLDKRLGALQS